MPSRNRPMRRAPAKRAEPETTHVIHNDGSYTNEPVAKVAISEKSAFEKFKEEVGLNSEIKIAGKRVGYVYCKYDHGVRVKPKRGVNPDLGSCPYVSWDQIKTDMEG